jgi:hypothetical protein
MECRRRSRQAPFKRLFVPQINFVLLLAASSEGEKVRRKVKITQHKARDVKSGETVLDRGTRFIIKEVRVSAEHSLITFIDMEDVWHGVYHPDEYLGVREIESN